MKIALISFEYPPDTAYGGIATYAFQAASMLQRRGHHVEVFASTPSRTESRAENGLMVHRIREPDRRQFGMVAGPAFAERHATVQFDVLESPEYHADGREALRLVPGIPLVVKLHTPSSIVLRLNYYEQSLLGRIRLGLGSLRHGRRPHWGYAAAIEGYRAYVADVDRAERALAGAADEIVSPSKALGREITRSWRLAPDKVVTIPYPFEPPSELLAVPIETHTNRVTFIGRLEVRKGVLDLARAIPRIAARHPAVRFRFIGASEGSPRPDLDMCQYLKQQLRDYTGILEFAGPVPYEKVPSMLAETDVCIFPSRWENFPFVCLESMAAGRGVIGSSAGGMADMLAGNRTGRLVAPGRPSEIVHAVAELLARPSLRVELGRAARERVIREYNGDRVGALREQSYARAIERRRSAGVRGWN